MDMKKILEVFDSKASVPASATHDMKSFLTIVEGKDTKTNRLSVAEQMVVSNFTATPVLNAAKKVEPSIISKYIDTIKEEFDREAVAHYAPARKLAARVTEKMLGEAAPVGFKPDEDVADTVTVDVPLLIRLLEYAREDAKTDMDLHNVAEQMIALSKETDTLSMEHYDAIVGEQQALPAPDTVDEDCCRVCGQTPCNCTHITESSESFTLYINGKVSTNYETAFDARRDIATLKAKFPSHKFVLKHEVCKDEPIDEVSNELLTRYKTAASADASKADKAGNFERGNKRFSGIVKATNKQFANDAKKHK